MNSPNLAVLLSVLLSMLNKNASSRLYPCLRRFLMPKGGTSLPCSYLSVAVHLVCRYIPFCSLCIIENNTMLSALLSTLLSRDIAHQWKMFCCQILRDFDSNSMDWLKHSCSLAFIVSQCATEAVSLIAMYCVFAVCRRRCTWLQQKCFLGLDGCGLIALQLSLFSFLYF